MKKWKQEIMVLGGIICLYGCSVLGKEMEGISGIWNGGISQSIQDISEKAFFPGIVYEQTEKITIHGYLAEQAWKLVPLAGYLSETEESERAADDEITYEMLVKMQGEDEDNEVVSQENISAIPKVELSIEKLKDFDYLISKFYTVDSVTYVKESDFNVTDMLAKDMSINKEENGPKVLIFHTHSQEAFANSAEMENGTIVGVGEYLTKLLNEVYGIETIHHIGVYDKINGSLDRSQAYERAKPEIKKILEANPSIEVVIDLHRDGVGENTHLVTEVNGKQTAQIMFFNGMCRTRTNGDLSGMQNPYLQDNLAFSLQMKIAAEETYPGFARRNYLKGYRYNMDLIPKMLLVEAGAQTNTVEEVMNAMEPLAELLNEVLTY